MSTPIHVSIGNFNIDIAVYIDKAPGIDESVNARDIDIRPGGAASNYAVAVSHYGHRAVLVASVADHLLVKTHLESIRRLGVDISHVTFINASPGIVISVIYPDGSRSMIRSLGANAYLSPDKISQEILDSASVVHMATLHPERAAGIVERVHGAVVSYDPGIYVNTQRETLETVLKHVDILFLNSSEFKELTGKIKPVELFKLGVEVLAIKLGSKGAAAVLGDGSIYHAYVKPLGNPVDTTGAGDAFNAFFNASYIDTRNVMVALRHGVAAGALKTLCKGSILCWDRDLFIKHLELSTISKETGIPGF